MNIKITKLVLLITYFAVSAYAKPIEISQRISNEPSDIYPYKILEVERNPELYTEDYEQYESKIIDELSVYLNSMDKLTVNEKLIKEGHWILVNSDNAKIENHYNMLVSSYFDIDSVDGMVEYNYADNVSYIWKTENGFCFYPSEYVVMLKKMILHGEQIYFYTLNGENWELDPIHEGGKYFYICESK